jgi:nitrogen-specific signal transduction histidine kinase/ActR/RegA family two-component response regulator
MAESVDESPQPKDVELSEERLQQARKLEAVGQLAGGLAHDFNNLMGVILGYCDILEEQSSLPAPALQAVGHIHRAGASARNLMQRLMAFSRQQSPQPVVLDLNSAVQQMQAMFHGVLGSDIEIRSVLGRGLGAIKADPTQVEQVLINLVINARDAMPGGGKIVVETANVEVDPSQQQLPLCLAPGPYVRLIVSDTGTGIAPEIQAHLFEPFFSTKPAGKGTGLGLSTIFGIVKQMGGAVDVSTKQGKGTAFKVYFPRCMDSPLSVAPSAAMALAGGTETILLVEDTAPLRQLTREMLRSHGYNVLDAGDPEEALRLARDYAGPLTLLVTDLFLPGYSGSLLAEKLTPIHPETKVLYTSGYLDDSIVQPGLRGEDYEFLQKPFTREELLHVVCSLMQTPRLPVRRPARSVVGTLSTPVSLA